ncbi:hypothetical protein HAX54_041341 [Datura stramonium]|uniref:Uncharacterized protein n=1 Tax=Datura stramonium TaxID=4076 RepID=A0ABS8SL81_DATST|nr:hypothetical protein [Datura stramonium]
MVASILVDVIVNYKNSRSLWRAYDTILKDISPDKEMPDVLLGKACIRGAKDWDPSLCLRILMSYPKIMSATDGVSFAIEIIVSGMENTTTTLRYIYGRLNGTTMSPVPRRVLEICASSFKKAFSSFVSANIDLSKGDYERGDYYLFIVYDQVERCGYYLSKYNVEDPVISTGMRYVTYFSQPALNIVEDIIESP